MFRTLLALAAAGTCFAQATKPHPRLIALDSDIARVKQLIKTDAFARELYTRLKQDAARIEEQPPVEYKLIGPRLLDKSRRCLDRVYTLALLYRLDGDRRYLDRALKELRAAAAFPDWNPKHFLDTAEMTHAFAIGYDWLYPALNGEDRALLRKAIVEKGLDQAIPFYKENRWWAKAIHNWNQVCNGGIAIGALAVADEETAKAGYIVPRSVESIKLAMASYAPEGGWAEGPGYWHYATRYNVYYLAALETALGTDYGLSAMKGFSQAGDFRMYFSGPEGTFNYADAHHGIGNAEEMFWLGRKFKQPVFAWDEIRRLKEGRPHALDLVWYEPKAVSPAQAKWPLARLFRGVEVAFLRSNWEDPDAFWVGVKGGDNKANHSHLDLGSFVFDAKGQRWAEDLGSDNYNMPNYFGNLRWTYYRLRTESHNVVLIDGANQDPKAEATFLKPYVVDLTRAYPGKLRRHTREVSLDGAKFTVRDDLEALQPVEALWGMVTAADVTVNGKRAELRQGGASLAAEIVSPQAAVFEIVSAAAPPPQNPNRGARKLVVRLPGKVTTTRIEVSFR